MGMQFGETPNRKLGPEWIQSSSNGLAILITRSNLVAEPTTNTEEAATKIRVHLSSLLLIVAFAASSIFFYERNFLIYTDRGIYKDRYIENVVQKRLATLPDLSSLTLTYADIEKHLKIESAHIVLLPTVNVCEEWGQDRFVLSPSYVLQLRSCYDDSSDTSTWVTVTIERINNTDFLTDRETLEKHLSPRYILPSHQSTDTR